MQPIFEYYEQNLQAHTCQASRREVEKKVALDSEH
jgi:hypothetical protein